MSIYNERTFDGPSMIRLLWRRKWWIMGTTAVVVILVVLLTSLQPKKYVASGLVIPPSTNDLENFIHQPRYGYDVEADRLIQMLASGSLRDTIVKLFDLLDYYDLDTSKAGWNAQLSERFYRDINFNRTRYMSVAISAKMDNPRLSADVVNALIDNVDYLRQRVFKKSVAQQLASIKRENKAREREVYRLGDSLYSLSAQPGKRALRMLYYQLKFGEGLNLDKRALFDGSGDRELQPSDELLVSEYLGAQHELQESRKKLERLEAMMERPVPGIYVVDRAGPSYEKVLPSYKRNVAIAGLATLVFSIVVVLLVARLREIFTNNQ